MGDRGTAHYATLMIPEKASGGQEETMGGKKVEQPLSGLLH